jgi:protein-S-isoprenylcysteine O-methyltransferase Ste14
MEPNRGYFYCVLGWVIWCTLHSALISITVTNYAKKNLGREFRFYRLFYNVFFLCTLVPLLFYSTSLEQGPLFRWHGPLLNIQYFLIASSAFLFIAGGWNYSILKFLGIQQIKTGRENQSLSDHGTFVVSGIHRMIRHPWYLGGMMIVWARNVSLLAILINIVITGYFIIGTYLEERKLIREFGEQYREYQANVSKFFPYKWLKAKIMIIKSRLCTK